jgi:membrane-bound ClpP family serine protease
MRFPSSFSRLAKLAGVIWIIIGLGFLVCSYVFPADRVMDGIAGVFVIAIGVAFLMARPITDEQLNRTRGPDDGK